ncbi:MAG: hypothetical protein ACFFDW_14860 [Candidatus Thorarchaeota archaeon]
MGSTYIYVLVGVLGAVFAFLVYGLIYLLLKRYRRNIKGDIYLQPQDTRPKEELPVELRAQRDYRYKDADIDPYKKD